jgi:type IV secretory pathway VirB4 component
MKFEMKDKKAHPGKTTQSFLKISEIKNDTVILDDGSLRAIVAVSSTNFDLKSQEEQDALIYSFQRFLNSLEFPIQILMQSRKMEIGNYLEKLKKLAEKQTNELLRVQTTEYMEFISRLIENASIMNKNFYVIVPLGENILPKAPGFFSKLFASGNAKQTAERIENFEKAKEKLDTRVLAVAANLSSLGVKGQRLKTEEIIQLYYDSYNFEAGPCIDPKVLAEIKTVEKP